MEEYKREVSISIHKLLTNAQSDLILNDVLLDSFIQQNQNSLRQWKRIKQLQMKIGEIWETAFSKFPRFENLKHSHGLDVISVERKFIFEIKNRYNTDNASARKQNYLKLAKFKKTHPEYTVVYGVINDRKPEGKFQSMVIDDAVIQYVSGKRLMRMIFGNQAEEIVSFIQNEVNKHLLV